MPPSTNAFAVTDELERTLGGTGWPNSLKHQIAHIIDRHFLTVRRDPVEVPATDSLAEVAGNYDDTNANGR